MLKQLASGIMHAFGFQPGGEVKADVPANAIISPGIIAWDILEDAGMAFGSASYAMLARAGYSANPAVFSCSAR